MTDKLWHNLCEDVWNKDVVVDVTKHIVTIKSLERWFIRHGVVVRRPALMRLAVHLSRLLRENSIQTANYGVPPKDIPMAILEETKQFLRGDIELLQSFSVDDLQEAGEVAGFELGVVGTNGLHPTDYFE